MNDLTLHHYAIFAAAAYENKPRISGYDVEAVRRWQTDCFIFKSPDEIVVAFRGTENAREWRNDFRFLKVGMMGLPGRYHRGFVRAVEVVIGPLASRLSFLMNGYADEPMPIRLPVIFVGHSLGGALAQLAAIKLSKCDRHLTPQRVITYGSPRFANVPAAWHLQKEWKCKILRVEVYGDGICHTPMAIAGYRHIGKPYQIGAGFAPKSTILGRFMQKALRTSAAHRIERYLKLLRGGDNDSD